ncbi:hypothetical protein [Bradyrhizobium sp. USDA 4486]
MLTSCDFCEREIPSGATVCPYCGHVQKTGTEWSSQHRSVLLAIVLSVGVMIAWSTLRGPH